MNQTAQKQFLGLVERLQASAIPSVDQYNAADQAGRERIYRQWESFGRAGHEKAWALFKDVLCMKGDGHHFYPADQRRLHIKQTYDGAEMEADGVTEKVL